MSKSIQSQRATVLSALFHDYEGPVFAIRLWDGWCWSSSSDEKPVCTLVIENPQALQSLISHPNELTLGEAFIYGDLNIEGDLFSVFTVAEHIFHRPRTWRQHVAESSARALFDLGRWFKHGSLHSQRRDRASISYHYDQPVEFYRPWLGQYLAYSCAYFQDEKDTLDATQKQKLDLICRKLRLKPQERFLDIGCGWGSLILHAANHYQAQALGITLSQRQAEEAKHRIELSGLNRQCDVELRDYRTLENMESPFDKIASIGMVEHVGLKNLPLYFKIVRNVLKPGGVFLNHGITRADVSPNRKSSFMDKYVFPDGHLVTLSQVLKAAESQGWEVRDVENLREHYALTLRHWVEGLRQNSGTLLQHVSEVTYRIWLLYMTGSAAAFHRGDIAVHQVLFSHSDRGRSQLPLTREDWYLNAFTGQKVNV